MEAKANVRRGGRDLTVGSEWKVIVAFAIPIIFGNLLQQLYNTVDGVVVGRFIDSNALAAVGTCSTLARFFIAFSMGFSNGCGIIVSQLFGAKLHKDLKKAFSTGAIIAVAVGAVLTILGVCFHNWILSAVMNVKDESVLFYAKQYFTIYCAGLIFTYIYNHIAYSLRAMGDSKATLYFLAMSSVLNLILDLFMVKLMGVAGAAAATVISQVVCAVMSYLYMIKRHEMLALKITEFRIDRETAGKCIDLGIPAVLQQCSASLGNLMMQRLVNEFGGVTMSAFTVGAKVDGYMQAPVQGIQQSVATFTGQNMGAGKMDRVKRGLYKALAINVGIILVVGTVINIFASPLSTLFGLEGDALNQAIQCIRFSAPYCSLVFAVYFTCAGLLHGSGDVKFATFITLSALVIRLIVAYTCVYGFEFGYPILWQSAFVSNALSVIFAWLRYFSGKWKKQSEKITGHAVKEDG